MESFDELLRFQKEITSSKEFAKNELLFQRWTVKTKVGRLTDERLKCYDCQYPPCSSCGQRPIHAIMHNAMHKDKYFCSACKFPPCQVCHTPQISGNMKAQRMFKAYTCTSCKKAKNHEDKDEKECQNCKISFAESTGVWVDNHHYCSQSCAFPTAGNPECHNCKTPCASSTATLIDNHHYCSKSCAYPTCANPECEHPRPTNHQKYYVFHNKPVWHCTSCGDRDERECQNCKTSFAKSTGIFIDNHDYCGKSCAKPSCAHVGCGQERPAGRNKKYMFHNTPIWHCKAHKSLKTK